MKTISRYLMTLVALFAMTAGAWADEATITLKCGTTEKTYENVTLPWSTTAEILKAVVTDIDFNINIGAITGGNDKVVKYGNENFTVTGTFSGEATVVVSYNMGSSATITVTAPAPLLTLNEAKTEATMESMPPSDVTIDYELVRDMSVQMTAQVGDDPEAQPRYRVKKDGNNWIPADLQPTDIPGLFSVTDGIENKTLTQSTDYYCLFYKLDEQTLEPDGDGVELTDFDFAPGLYAVKAVAITGSDYDGETALSNTFKLFQGYEVTIPAGEYATYYRNEPLYADQQTSADAKLYTIESVSGDQAVLSSAIETAPSGTPLLIHNSGTEDKTFLLIPADAEPNIALTVYSGFIPTTEATTIAASTASTTNYALNGKQFVYVKSALDIGANKAYLSVTTSSASTARAINIVFGGTTGLDNLTPAISEGEGTWYDLNGRKLAKKPTRKGVYIMNGKKVVIK